MDSLEEVQEEGEEMSGQLGKDRRCIDCGKEIPPGCIWCTCDRKWKEIGRASTRFGEDIVVKVSDSATGRVYSIAEVPTGTIHEGHSIEFQEEDLFKLFRLLDTARLTIPMKWWEDEPRLVTGGSGIIVGKDD